MLHDYLNETEKDDYEYVPVTCSSFDKFCHCHIKCTEMFFGHGKYDNVTNTLLTTVCGLPSVDNRYCFKYCLMLMSKISHDVVHVML